MSERARAPLSIGRRAFILGSGVAVGSGVAGIIQLRRGNESGLRAAVAALRASSYDGSLESVVSDGLKAIGFGDARVRGRSVLLKPNLVEPSRGSPHINTHPALVRAAATVFRRLGAREVLVGEGPGHQRDTDLVLEESGLGEALEHERIPFVDLNRDDLFRVPNSTGFGKLGSLCLPATLRRCDLVVSMPKLKTHHWVGVTISLKNLFGLMPGSHYGWPKNTLHQAVIGATILDIAAAVRPALAIVDGIVGMEGDGPIMGTPRSAGVVLFGESLVAVDATASRIMGVDPRKIAYLGAASGRLGPILEGNIEQRGEDPRTLRQPFRLNRSPGGFLLE